MNRLAYKEYPLPAIKQHRGQWKGIARKTAWHFNAVTDHLIGTLGYLLTLATSLGLWYGIYATISIAIN